MRRAWWIAPLGVGWSSCRLLEPSDSGWWLLYRAAMVAVFAAFWWHDARWRRRWWRQFLVNVERVSKRA